MYGFSICQECFVDDIHYIAVDNGAGKVIQVANLFDTAWEFDNFSK